MQYLQPDKNRKIPALIPSWLPLMGLIVLLVSSTGCGSLRFWEDEDKATPPAELTKIDQTVRIKEIWKRDVGVGAEDFRIALTPVVQGERLFVAAPDGKVHAYDAKTGKPLWETDADVAITGGPGAGAGIVLVGSRDGEVVALTQGDGKILWKARVSSEVLTAPRAKDDVAVARTLDGKLFGLDRETGRRKWLYERSVPVLSLRGTGAPAIAGPLVIAGFDGGQLVALALENGRTIWEKRIVLPSGRSDIDRMVDIDGEPVVVGNAVYVVTFQGRVAALEATSGRGFWRREMSSYAGLGVHGNTVYVTDEKSHVWALDRFTGETRWTQEALDRRDLTAPVGVSPPGLGDYVAVGDFEGYVHLLRAEDGRIAARVRVDKERILTAPTVADDILYVYGGSGKLMAIGIEK
uniref:Outer membrane protein assembly factor BamB n=1 Tax=Candidatus Kentrum sp. DK TaxID=2126562 RepID=A0A450S010_9GAMM|nr:MAG: Beta-barrel assembly machine subunit BamB [Candidatus Kentron sp. DK]VFJ44868.1 MAG: Beta-barrel assembly machine subunit BamB [Candidatus Kentron sp. DK]